MKKTNKILSIIAISTATCGFSPMFASCSKGSTPIMAQPPISDDYVTDLDWTPTITQFVPTTDHYSHTTATVAYGEAAMQDPVIIQQDYYYKTINNAKLYLQYLKDQHYFWIEPTIKLRLNNLSVIKDEYTSLAGTKEYYLVTGVLDKEITFKYAEYVSNDENRNEGLYYYVDTLTEYNYFQNAQFGVQRRTKDHWIVGNDNGFLEKLPWDWCSIFDHVSSRDTYFYDKQGVTHFVDSTEKHYYKDWTNCAAPDEPTFSSYFFENAEPGIGVDFHGVVPEGDDRPTINPSAFKVGVSSFEGTINAPVIPGMIFKVNSLDMPFTKQKPTSFEFNPETKKLTVDFSDFDWDKIVNGDMQINFSYVKEQ